MALWTAKSESEPKNMVRAMCKSTQQTASSSSPHPVIVKCYSCATFSLENIVSSILLRASFIVLFQLYVLGSELLEVSGCAQPCFFITEFWTKAVASRRTLFSTFAHIFHPEVLDNNEAPNLPIYIPPDEEQEGEVEVVNMDVDEGAGVPPLFSEESGHQQMERND